MTRRWFMVAVAAVLTACGGEGTTAPAASDTESAPSASPDVTVLETADEQPESEASAGAVTAENFLFAPATLEVAVGATVTWTNADAATHTITAGTPDDPLADGFDFRLSSDSPTAEMRFAEAGEVAYFCKIHPTMLGTITVG